jgi:hypothetical protein
MQRGKKKTWKDAPKRFNFNQKVGRKSGEK